MVRLTFICHAATAATRQAAFPRDEALDARAMEEATAMAPAVARHERALTSPARRARETADCLGLAASVDDALSDLDYGRWAGLTLKELAANEQAALSSWMSDPGAAPHGGESIAALVARMADFLADLSTSDRLVAVTHAATMRAAVVASLGAPITAFWQIDVAPLTRVTLHGEGKMWRLREIVAHDR